MSQRLRVPVDCKELAEVVAREHGNIHRSADLSAAAVLRLLERCDAIRKPERFAQILLACECDARGRLGFESSAYPQGQRLARALTICLGVNTAEISSRSLQQGLKGPAIGAAIAHAREARLTEGLDAIEGGH